MKYLLIACLLLCGCRHPPAKAVKESLDQRLVGTWAITTADGETSITYSKDHRYSMKMGRPGFSTGFYIETGTWEIYDGDKIEVNPEDRKSSVAASDKSQTADIKAYEKVMDEGAWKPMPERVFSLNDNTLELGDKPITYRRVP